MAQSSSHRGVDGTKTPTLIQSHSEFGGCCMYEYTFSIPPTEHLVARSDGIYIACLLYTSDAADE